MKHYKFLKDSLYFIELIEIIHPKTKISRNFSMKCGVFCSSYSLAWRLGFGKYGPKRKSFWKKWKCMY